MEKRDRQNRRWEDDVGGWTGTYFASLTSAAEKGQGGNGFLAKTSPTTLLGYGIERPYLSVTLCYCFPFGSSKLVIISLVHDFTVLTSSFSTR